MAASWVGATAIVCALALAGSLYTVLAGLLATRFAGRPSEPPRDGVRPAVTILKPLHGAEPRLEEALASFLRQDYPAPVRVVFGVQDADDPARRTVAALLRRFPGNLIVEVVDPRQRGRNGKVANLMNMAERMGAGRPDDVIVLADSDMLVGPDYLRRVVSALGAPGVDLVTCLYHGLAEDALPARVMALGLDGSFLPNAILGIELGLAAPCFGSTVALRRGMLERIGGFACVKDTLADDYALGAAVRAAGGTVGWPAFTIGHVCGERSFGAVLAHELRWARTVRSIDPWGFAGSVVTHPVPLALLALALGAPAARLWAGAALLVALACRCGLVMRIRRLFGLRGQALWLVPFRDALSFAVFVSSFFGTRVAWRGRLFTVEDNGDLSDQRARDP